MKKAIIALSSLIIWGSILFAMVIHTPQFEPEDGIWVCEELQIQLDYSGHSETYIIENGKKIHCGCGSDRGIKQIEVSCQERNHPIYKVGELVFCAEIKKLTDNTLLVCDPKTKQEFVFIRVDQLGNS